MQEWSQTMICTNVFSFFKRTTSTRYCAKNSGVLRHRVHFSTPAWNDAKAFEVIAAVREEEDSFLSAYGQQKEKNWKRLFDFPPSVFGSLFLSRLLGPQNRFELIRRWAWCNQHFKIEKKTQKACNSISTFHPSKTGSRLFLVQNKKKVVYSLVCTFISFTLFLSQSFPKSTPLHTAFSSLWTTGR